MTNGTTMLTVLAVAICLKYQRTLTLPTRISSACSRSRRRHDKRIPERVNDFSLGLRDSLKSENTKWKATLPDATSMRVCAELNRKTRDSRMQAVTARRHDIHSRNWNVYNLALCQMRTSLQPANAITRIS